MDHYRVNKVAKPGGPVVKARDVIASSDRQAIKDAAEHEDCPVCEVWRAGKKIGQIL